ncbi:hypothetical protein LguiB_012752 [Lonicera macranthoides]
MIAMASRVSSSIFRAPAPNTGLLKSVSWEVQQWRGIRVKVINNNLEQVLVFMQRKMQSSGIERLIKREQIHHIKNSEKRVIARKNLEAKLRSQDLARKLKSILIKKVRLGFLVTPICNHY